ncbi:ABC transporter permease [Actinopolyspora erythraea]|uniref:ABC transporter permease n=1 Tax=Actinopolyspora erythraea TaxID=414996 RepID=UPI000A825E9A|nr:ABC transporter permease [Actinopolyspora erythraea]
MRRRNQDGAEPPEDVDTTPDRPSSGRFAGEIRDAVSGRTFLLIVGVLLLQLGFVLSYVGAFHQPAPHRIPLTVVGPAPAAERMADRLDGLPDEPLRARTGADRSSARQLLTEGATSAVFVLEPAASADRLLLATAGGSAKAEAVERIVGQVQRERQRSLSVRDVVPAQPGDSRGLTGFYLVVGWTVGGYLVASLLGVSRGARPANPTRASIRLAAVVLYAAVSGLGGALVVGPWLGALTGHVVPLWWLGALLVFAAAAVTMAFQALFGVLGIGLTVLLFVVLGNPSAGGAYAPEMLPAFWRAISGALPNGAGTEAVRHIVYFGSHGVAGDVLVIAAYALGGVVVALVGALLRSRRGDGDPSAGAFY